jgi:hypothetical protein
VSNQHLNQIFCYLKFYYNQQFMCHFSNLKHFSLIRSRNQLYKNQQFLFVSIEVSGCAIFNPSIQHHLREALRHSQKVLEICLFVCLCGRQVLELCGVCFVGTGTSRLLNDFSSSPNSAQDGILDRFTLGKLGQKSTNKCVSCSICVHNFVCR